MKLKLFIFLLIALPLVSFGQKYKVTSGDYSNLSGVEDIDVQLDYSQVTFYKEKMSEEEYIEKRKTDKDGDDIDEIQEEWEKTKETSIPNKVFDLANKYADNGMKFHKDSGAKYTMIVRPIWIYPGWFGGVMKSPSKLTVVYEFIETSNPDKVVLSIMCTKAVGDQYPLGIANTNARITEAFAHATKGLAKNLKKKVK